MLVAVDIGNTNIVVGFIDRQTIVGTYRITTKVNHTSDEYGLMLTQFMQLAGVKTDDITDVIIASVVPKVMYSFRSSIVKFLHKNPLIVGPGVKTGLNIRLDNPRSLGADCLADCVGAWKTYQSACLVIDFGTATTYNYVDSSGSIICGLITTGIRTAAAALWESTAQLPEVEIKRPRTLFAKNTQDAMQTGLYYSFLGGIACTIAQFKQEIDEPFKVIATGGLGRLFEHDIPTIDIYDPDLMLKGMAAIYEQTMKRA